MPNLGFTRDKLHRFKDRLLKKMPEGQNRNEILRGIWSIDYLAFQIKFSDRGIGINRAIVRYMLEHHRPVLPLWLQIGADSLIKEKKS